MNVPERNETRIPPSLDPPPQQIQEMGMAAIQLMAKYFAELPSKPILTHTSSDAIREQLDQQLPVTGQEFDTLLMTIQDAIFPSSRHNGHPRFFGYIASPGTPATAIADLLASTLNPNVTSWRSAPGPTEVERLTIQWIKEIIGYDPEGEGIFVSGGSIANFCAIAAARRAKAPIHVTDVGAQALTQVMRIYISEEGHYSTRKAAGLLGIGRGNVREIKTNSHFQIDVQALRDAIEEDLVDGYLPICVVGTPGTVQLGSCDPLNEIADVAAEYNLWFHVDACYGGFAALAPSKRHLFQGIERADSVALDPHKWLFLPSDCSCILYRDPAQARATFGFDTDYVTIMADAPDEAFAFWDFGPELTRRFRALKTWMMLSHVGTKALGEAVENNCACARYLAELVNQADDFEMLAPVELSIFCFRYVPPALKLSYTPTERAVIDEELNGLNEQILKQLQKGGSSYLSNANVGGHFALRGCVVNFRTTYEDMAILLDDIRQVAHAIQEDSES